MSSEVNLLNHRAFGSRFAALTVAAVLAAISPRVAQGKVFLSLPEALAKAYPPEKHCQSRAENHYLTAEQLRRAQELSGLAIPSALVVRYAATCDGKPAGYAYTDTHRVRTHPETLLILVDPAHRIARVEVLSFDEPLEYIPREAWYGTFQGSELDPELQIKRRIPYVTGASLTAQATAQAARRALAIDQVLSK